jgi:hypothetical protein
LQLTFLVAENQRLQARQQQMAELVAEVQQLRQQQQPGGVEMATYMRQLEAENQQLRTVLQQSQVLVISERKEGWPTVSRICMFCERE